MAFNKDNLVIDRAIKGSMKNKATSAVLWTVDQIKDPSIECTGETVYALDSVGAKIAGFERSKDCTLTFSNSVFNLSLAAAQFGSTKSVASASNLITVPKYETITLGATGEVVNTTITLAETPKTTLKKIYKLDTDGSILEEIQAGATATTQFSITDKVITLPTTPASGAYTATTKFGVWYDYECSGSEGLGAVKVSNNASEFPTSGIFELEVLFADICDPSTKYHGFVVFGNAKLSSNTTINLTTEIQQNVQIDCMQDYCDAERTLFDIIIPE